MGILSYPFDSDELMTQRRKIRKYLLENGENLVEFKGKTVCADCAAEIKGK